MSDFPMEMNYNFGETQIKTRKPRGTGIDARRTAYRLNGFQPRQSKAYKAIVQRFSKNLVQSDLVMIALILTHHNKDLRLDRDAKRDKRVMFKWFDENWFIIHKEIDKIEPLDENFKVVNFFAQN